MKKTRKFHCSVVGGAINTHDLHAIIKQSYQPTIANVNGYEVDKSLSGRRAQVYHNRATGHTVVAHKGTQSLSDWITNLQFAAGYTGGKRWQHARKIQQEAANKYGTSNTTTVGHSLGAALSHNVGALSGDTVSLDRPVRLVDTLQKAQPNSTDIRSRFDPISWLRPLQSGGNQVVIPSSNWTPLAAHSPDELLKLNQNRIYN